MSDETTACPECDSTDIFSRRHDWRCREDDCGATFDEPVLREPNSAQTQSGTSQKLANANPEDFGLSPMGER